jgi:DNA-binding beta-propeller fold protein YncE
MSSVHVRRCGAALFLLLSLTLPAAAAYRQIKKAVIGGEGGWDFLTVDAQARRLYLSRSTHVLVLDADSCVQVGDIPETPGIHGVALVPELGRGVTSNGADSSATVFDLKTLKVLGKVPTGPRPDAIVYDPASKLVFTMNAGGSSATAIDVAAVKAGATLPLGGRPEVAVPDGKGHLFVNLEDSSAVAVVDTKKLAVVAHWSLAPGEEPTGLALDNEHGRLFAGCANQLLVVLDSRSGKVVAKLPIGKGVDGVAFDASKGLAISSNGEGNLTVVQEVSPDSFTVRETVPTQAGARTLALDEMTHRIFTVSAEFGPAPAPTPEHPRPRRTILPGTFTVLVYSE